MEQEKQSTDIVAFLQSADKWIGDELDLARIRPGDRLLVRTRNTNYLFYMTGTHTATLTTDRSERPGGSVEIHGCVFGRSSIIKPGHLFCGGGLEILYQDTQRKTTTTPIEAIQLIVTNQSDSSPTRPTSEGIV
jgi:hypothetical protein